MATMRIFIDDELTKEEEVYPAGNWDEIPDNVREKIFQKHGDMLVDYGWWEFIYEDAKNVGLKIGSFDLGGASYVKGDFLLSANEVAQNIMAIFAKLTKQHKTFLMNGLLFLPIIWMKIARIMKVMTLNGNCRI